MTRIPDELLGCVFFLYPSRADAEGGNAAGATGFFVGIDWQSNEQRRHLYAVTNTHNVTACRDSVVLRATTVNGALEFIETDPVEWHPSPAHDISVFPISPQRVALFENVSDGRFITLERFKEIHTNDFGTQTGVGPGDEVFMIGRFISHDGKTENV